MNSETKEQMEKDTRPVICYICRRKMYYSEHPKHEKEMKLYKDNQDFVGWVHAKCIRTLRKMKSK